MGAGFYFTNGGPTPQKPVYWQTTPNVARRVPFGNKLRQLALGVATVAVRSARIAHVRFSLFRLDTCHWERAPFPWRRGCCARRETGRAIDDGLERVYDKEVSGDRSVEQL